ncbi:MAG TPA: FAD-dependent monooxygenase [Micropepsaceae bacterium]|jgi:salicylate hydroxylase|nr:FAD-dependent monooxygenase [Micropepsaceae bacterium]
MRIGIIGTGVAGSLFVAAAKDVRGVTLHAFDRIPPNNREEAGTGLNIGPNALKAMRLHGGLSLDALRAASLPWRRWIIALTNGTKIIDLDLLDVAEEPGLRIRWADLYRILRARSAPMTQYARSLEALEQDSEGRLVPVFREPAGSLVREGAFDLLVAADGRYSRLRELVDGVPRSVYPGIGTWRLLVRDAANTPIDDYGQYFCGNARLLSFRLPNDCVYVAGSFPLAGTGSVPDYLKTARAQRRFFQPETGTVSPEVEWMLNRLDRHVEDMNWARTQEIETLHHTLGGRVLLLGDAAHAMFQTLGQGATQAIEDALVAAAVLREEPQSPKTVCTSYEARRRDRIEFAKHLTREATDTLLGSDPVAGSLAKAQEPFLTKLRQLYVDVA